MPDTNMNIAYSWACDLSNLSYLKMTLDINQRIHLILDIEREVDRYSKYDLSGSGLFENFSGTVKEIFLNRIDDIVRRYIPDERMRNIKKALDYDCGLAACLAAKTIALDTRDGRNTPNLRTKIFQDLDRIADQDPIYRAGVESAPLLKKKRQTVLFIQRRSIDFTSKTKSK